MRISLHWSRWAFSSTRGNRAGGGMCVPRVPSSSLAQHLLSWLMDLERGTQIVELCDSTLLQTYPVKGFPIPMSVLERQMGVETIVTWHLGRARQDVCKDVQSPGNVSFNHTFLRVTWARPSLFYVVKQRSQVSMLFVNTYFNSKNIDVSMFVEIKELNLHWRWLQRIKWAKRPWNHLDNAAIFGES